MRYKAGVRAFPQLVMTDPAMPGVPESRAALKFWSEQWNGQAFMAIGAADPVLGVEVMRKLHALIRGCGEPLVIADGGHFLQEWGADIAAQGDGLFRRDQARPWRLRRRRRQPMTVPLTEMREARETQHPDRRVPQHAIAARAS